jgi:hypothetical protein
MRYTGFVSNLQANTSVVLGVAENDGSCSDKAYNKSVKKLSVGTTLDTHNLPPMKPVTWGEVKKFSAS